MIAETGTSPKERRLWTRLLLLPILGLLLLLAFLPLEAVLTGQRMRSVAEPDGIALQVVQERRFGNLLSLRSVSVVARLPDNVTGEAYLSRVGEQGWQKNPRGAAYRRGSLELYLDTPRSVRIIRNGSELSLWLWGTLAYATMGALPGLAGLLLKEPALGRVAGASLTWAALVGLTVSGYCAAPRGRDVEGLWWLGLMILAVGLFALPFSGGGGPGLIRRRIGLGVATVLAAAGLAGLHLLGAFCHFTLW